MATNETIEKIQSAARELFTQHGYEGVSLRMLIRAADVNQAAINYHFKSKYGVYESLIIQYVEQTEGYRLQTMKSDKPTKLIDIIDTLTRPFFTLAVTPHGRQYTKFIARYLHEPQALFQPLYARHFRAMAMPFLTALKTFNLNDRQAASAYSLILRTMAAQIDDPLSGVLHTPLKRLPTIDRLTKRTATICAAAITAMAKEQAN